MKNTITETTRLLLQGNLTKEEADKILLDLHSVMLSLPSDEEISVQAKRKYPYQKTKGGTYYEGKSKGYAEGANWMKFQIEKLNEA